MDMESLLKGIYNVAYGVWNSLMTVAMTLFTTSPTSASGSVYSTTHTLYSAISSISVPIATCFFLIAIIKDVVSSPPDQQAKRFFLDALKFGIMIGILANLWDIMGYIMQIADGITDAFSTSASYELSISSDLESIIAEAAERPSFSLEDGILSIVSSVLSYIGSLVDWLLTFLLFFVAGLVTLVVIVASSISILSSAYQRIIKPLVIMPFSSIAVAMAAGSHEAERVATSYLKTFFGFCISGAFMVISVKIGSALVDGLIIFDLNSLSLHEKVLYISIQNIITPICISGLIKSVDSIIGRFF